MVVEVVVERVEVVVERVEVIVVVVAADGARRKPAGAAAEN